MIERIRRLSPRAEKTIRLVAVCAVAAVLGIIAVVRDSEALGYAAVAIVLAGILAGPLVARLLAPPEGSG
ncbi:MAG TPA: hypothetical protein VFG74_04560 [Miltoncostaeaceae bacterium]|jgi:hypothetical protein|nr:hypothetical protein [Miltoncostaeaceae bacterium]